MTAYCDLCDLPLDQCPHGRPEPVAPPKPPAAPRKSAAPRRAAATQPKIETRRVSTARRTSQGAFRPAILEILRGLGGSGDANDILAAVEQLMAPRLLPGDYDLLENEPRWRRAARFERKDMVTDGLIEPILERGVWQLTPRGLDEN